MRAIKCEMCNSNDIIKQDGYYVCQSCGTKYSTEEARKMMIEGHVDVSGSTIRIDRADEIRNLYELARRARHEDNRGNAKKYYDLILLKDASSWEANFYSAYYHASGSPVNETILSAKQFINSVLSVLRIVRNSINDEGVKREAISQISNWSVSLSRTLYNAAVNYYNSLDEKTRESHKQELVDNCLSTCNICYTCGDYIAGYFGPGYTESFSVPCWKEGIDQHKSVIQFMLKKNDSRERVLSYVSLVQAHDASYPTPNLPKDEACYVATAVYGSYDCPQVWILRRYRDFYLAKSWFGRLFIKLYYAISPSIVRMWGKKVWFSIFWQKKLNRLIAKLKSAGYDDSPYSDVSVKSAGGLRKG